MGALGGSHAPGATPIDPDEVSGLMPKHITTQGQLNEWETSNILAGRNWAFNRRYRGDILSEDYVRKLHRQMFNQTWGWAGTFRKSEKSIGVDPARIAVGLRDLLENVKFQRPYAACSLDETAAKLHHRLVSIHPFANGNGRHARLFTEVFLHQNGALPFSWGQVNLNTASSTRTAYIAALQAADARDYAPLLKFVRS